MQQIVLTMKVMKCTARKRLEYAKLQILWTMKVMKGTVRKRVEYAMQQILTKDDASNDAA